MKLLFKQKFFSWLDSYDVFDESGSTVYTVRGELAWGHQLRIYDAYGNELGLRSYGACVDLLVCEYLDKVES